jgi:hypothetical protein
MARKKKTNMKKKEKKKKKKNKLYDCYTYIYIGRCRPKPWGYPPNHPVLMDDLHGDLGLFFPEGGAPSLVSRYIELVYRGV